MNRIKEYCKYYPELKVKNLQQLRPGFGARYLECIKDHNGELIAKSWKRTVPTHYEVIIDFEGDL